MWRVSLKWKWEVQFQPIESDIMCLTKFKVTWGVLLKWKWEVQFQPLESDIMCLTKFKVTWGVSLKWKWEVPAWISMQRLHPHSSGGSTILGPVYSLTWFPHFFSFFIGIFGHKLKSYHFQRYQLHFIRTSSQGMTFARKWTLDPESYPQLQYFDCRKGTLQALLTSILMTYSFLIWAE